MGSRTRADEFEIAIRTSVNQSSINLSIYPLPRFNGLFNTARQFNMEVQPQLILSKNIAQYRRSRSSIISRIGFMEDIYPVLKEWMNEQIGFKSVVDFKNRCSDKPREIFQKNNAIFISS